MSADPLPPVPPRAKRAFYQKKRFYAGLALLALLIVAIAHWRPLGVWLLRANTQMQFRSQFRGPGGRDVQRDRTDWAWQFGGTAGLPALKRLAEDPAINPRGQKLAREIHRYISRGTHLPRLGALVDAYHGVKNGLVPPHWPAGPLVEHIYERDLRALGRQRPRLGPVEDGTRGR